MSKKCNCSAHGGFLTAKGLEEAAQRGGYSHETIDMFERNGYLDIVGSVSGSPPSEAHWDDALIEEQHRRFHNGT